MGIDRGIKLKALKEKVPSRFDPVNNPKDLRRDFEASHNDALNAVHVADKALQTTLHQLGVKELADGDISSSLSSGYRASGAHMAGGSHRVSSENKKRKDTESLRRLLMLQAQLDRLYQDLDAIDKQIDQNTKALEAINEIYELAANDAFDPESNSGHMELLKQAGITLEEYQENEHKVLADRVDELNAENDRLTKERNERIAEIREIEDTADPDDVQAYFAKKELRNSNIDAWHKHVEIQEYDGVKSRPDLDFFQNTRQMLLSVDEEVGMFIQGYEEAKLISDPLERLEFEKNLVDSVSDEARESLSMEEGIDRLFEDGYFDPLEEKTETALAQNKAPLSTPSI